MGLYVIKERGMEMIHFVFGDSAIAALAHAFRGEGHQIYGLPLDFSVGPISAIHEEDSIQRYFDWLNSSFNIRDDHSTYQEETYRQSLEKLKSLKDGDEITIWTCENASEQIGLRLVCFLAADKKVDLFMVNTAKAMDDFMEDSDIQFDIRHSGECNGKQLVTFYKDYRKAISPEMAEAFSQDAKRLLSSTSLLRSWKLGGIVDDEESRDDEFIMDCLREQQDGQSESGYVKAVRVIGQVFGESHHIYSDYWIDYRIRSLIHSGQLISRGDLRSMRSYEVRASEIEV